MSSGQLVIRITQGYPYFLQVWGYIAWDHAKTSTIDLKLIHEITSLATEELNENFFSVRYNRLTSQEKKYLRLMAENKKPAEDLNAIRDSLIEKGMIYSPAPEEVEFSVPLFGDFMKRVMPEFPLSE